jgi:hypothetical protein
MTTVAVKDIGFCADFTPQGDWAFEYALSLARSLGRRLNIFYVPGLAWDTGREPARVASHEKIALDRQVREYYDEKLGDYVDVGFRICEGFADTELRRCLMTHVYQVLVAGYPEFGARFAGRTIEEFAYAFNGPMVLVGPDRPTDFFVNPPAALMPLQLGLEDREWRVVTSQTRLPTTG